MPLICFDVGISTGVIEGMRTDWQIIENKVSNLFMIEREWGLKKRGGE